MQIRGLKTYYLKHREIIRDNKEGGRREAFSQTSIKIDAHIYDDVQNLKATSGGIQKIVEKVMLFNPRDIDCVHEAATKQVKYCFSVGENTEYVVVGDGLCVHVPSDEEPDYRIASIIWCGHLECKLERV